MQPPASSSCAKANDVDVTDAVAANESTRWRMNERENKIIVTSGYSRPLPARMAPRPALCFLDIFLNGRPTRHPSPQTRFRNAIEHDGRMLGSQLKTNLQF
jgi:hypothetical protein